MIITDRGQGTKSYIMGYAKINGFRVLHEVNVSTLKSDIDNDNHKRAYRNGAELFGTYEEAKKVVNEILLDIGKHIGKKDADCYLQFNPLRFSHYGRIVKVVGAKR